MKKSRVIHVAKTAGFCFGVRRAIRIAHEIGMSGGTTRASAVAPSVAQIAMDGRQKAMADKSPKASPRRVHMLGDLVHNQDVIAQLEKAGIKKISRLGHGHNKILLIRAHGAGKKMLGQALKRGYSIVDATCPMVHTIHKIVREMDRKGYRIIVLGDRRHEEVQGIVGQISRKTIVIDRIDRIPLTAIKRIKKAAIVVQSTQNTDEILPLVNALREKIKDVRFFNTICKPTRMKQAEMKNLPRLNDVVIVIGSRASANTRRLYEISRALNPRSYRVESAAEIKSAWFKQAGSVGITAGASTPQSATRSVIEKIRKIK